MASTYHLLAPEALPLITYPINFWQNSDLFKKNIFLAPKLTELEQFKDKGNLRKFSFEDL